MLQLTSNFSNSNPQPLILILYRFLNYDLVGTPRQDSLLKRIKQKNVTPESEIINSITGSIRIDIDCELEGRIGEDFRGEENGRRRSVSTMFNEFWHGRGTV